MGIPDRIQCILDTYSLNAQRFAEKIGAKTKQSIYDLLAGRTKSISKGMADKILSAFPEINESWLVSGRGNMILSDNGEMLKRDDAPDPELPLFIEEEASAGLRSERPLELVPLIPIGAFAGEVRGFSTEGVYVSQCEKVVSPVSGCDIAIDVSGDSMEPDFPNGCRVFCKRIYESAFIAWGNVFVLDTCNGAFIKRVLPSADENAVEARSINPNYPPFDIPKQSIYGMYRVLMMARGYSAS